MIPKPDIDIDNVIQSDTTDNVMQEFGDSFTYVGSTNSNNVPLDAELNIPIAKTGPAFVQADQESVEQ